MEILAGMILMCMMKVDVGDYGMFIRDVETKVHFIHPKGDAFVEYNLKKHKSLKFLGEKPLYDIVKVEDLESKDYMACRRIGQ